MTTAPTQAQIDATVAEAPNQSKWLWAQVVTALANQLAAAMAERDETRRQLAQQEECHMSNLATMYVERLVLRELDRKRSAAITDERDEAVAALRDWLQWTMDPNDVLAKARACLSRVDRKATP